MLFQKTQAGVHQRRENIHFKFRILVCRPLLEEVSALGDGLVELLFLHILQDLFEIGIRTGGANDPGLIITRRLGDRAETLVEAINLLRQAIRLFGQAGHHLPVLTLAGLPDHRGLGLVVVLFPLIEIARHERQPFHSGNGGMLAQAKPLETARIKKIDPRRRGGKLIGIGARLKAIDGIAQFAGSPDQIDALQALVGGVIDAAVQLPRHHKNGTRIFGRGGIGPAAIGGCAVIGQRHQPLLGIVAQARVHVLGPAHLGHQAQGRVLILAVFGRSKQPGRRKIHKTQIQHDRFMRRADLQPGLFLDHVRLPATPGFQALLAELGIIQFNAPAHELIAGPGPHHQHLVTQRLIRVERFHVRADDLAQTTFQILKFERRFHLAVFDLANALREGLALKHLTIEAEIRVGLAPIKAPERDVGQDLTGGFFEPFLDRRRINTEFRAPRRCVPQDAVGGYEQLQRLDAQVHGTVVDDLTLGVFFLKVPAFFFWPRREFLHLGHGLVEFDRGLVAEAFQQAFQQRLFFWHQDHGGRGQIGVENSEDFFFDAVQGPASAIQQGAGYRRQTFVFGCFVEFVA